MPGARKKPFEVIFVPAERDKALAAYAEIQGKTAAKYNLYSVCKPHTEDVAYYVLALSPKHAFGEILHLTGWHVECETGVAGYNRQPTTVSISTDFAKLSVAQQEQLVKQLAAQLRKARRK